MGLWVCCVKECIFIAPLQSLWFLETRTDVKEPNESPFVLSSPPLALRMWSSISLSLSLSPVFSSPLSSCLLSFSAHLLSLAHLSLPPPYNAICLTVAQHSMSWLCLNIDRKVNDKTTVLRCKHTQNYTHKETTTWLMNTACSVAWKQCYAMVDAKKHSHPQTHTYTRKSKVWMKLGCLPQQAIVKTV